MCGHCCMFVAVSFSFLVQDAIYSKTHKHSCCNNLCHYFIILKWLLLISKDYLNVDYMAYVNQRSPVSEHIHKILYRKPKNITAIPWYNYSVQKWCLGWKSQWVETPYPATYWLYFSQGSRFKFPDISGLHFWHPRICKADDSGKDYESDKSSGIVVRTVRRRSERGRHCCSSPWWEDSRRDVWTSKNYSSVHEWCVISCFLIKAFLYELCLFSIIHGCKFTVVLW